MGVLLRAGDDICREMPDRVPSRRSAIAALIFDLPGGSFAFVMTTGILSIAATLLFWVIATWWIPLLAASLLWRHVIQRIRPVFDPQYWSMVFPLGMYTAATWVLFVPKWPRISRSDTPRKHLECIGLMAARLCCNHAASPAPALPRTEELRA